MADYALIFQILGGLLAIFFIFLTVMNTKTWGWLHVTAMFLVFASACAFAPIAAMALKTRFNWAKLQSQWEKKVAAQDEEYHNLIYGNPSAADGGRESLLVRRNEYSRFIVDRGRWLKQCKPTVNADGTVTLQIAAAEAGAAAPGGAAPPGGAAAPPAGGAPPAGAPPAAGAAPAAPVVKNGFKAQEVVFAFAEAPILTAADPARPLPVPAYYLGQFEITAATDQSITMRRTIPQAPVVQQEGQFTWTVFETIPPDMHEVLDFAPEKRGEELAKLFPPLAADAPQNVRDAYNKMLNSYLRDGLPAEETDPPENVWIWVQFEKEVTVEVDAAVLVSPINDANFDSVGKAQVARLQRKEPVKFKKGDVALFDSQTATTLIANKEAKLAEGQARIFRRKLNDYENAFATLNRRMREVAAETARADQHLAELKAAIDKANEQIALLERDKAMLAEDQAKVAHERDELGKYRDSLAARVAEVRTELSRLYLSNKTLYENIKATSDRLTEEIDRRTREATAASAP